MGKMKEIYMFLEEYDIDTFYYLNEEAKELYNKDKLDLRVIEKLPTAEFSKYLDLEKLYKEEII